MPVPAVFFLPRSNRTTAAPNLNSSGLGRDSGEEDQPGGFGALTAVAEATGLGQGRGAMARAHHKKKEVRLEARDGMRKEGVGEEGGHRGRVRARWSSVATAGELRQRPSMP
jgi:hypothetical protein